VGSTSIDRKIADAQMRNMLLFMGLSFGWAFETFVSEGGAYAEAARLEKNVVFCYEIRPRAGGARGSVVLLGGVAAH